MEGRFAQGFGISVTFSCKLVAEACICAERREPLANLVAKSRGWRARVGLDQMLIVGGCFGDEQAQPGVIDLRVTGRPCPLRHDSCPSAV